MRRYIQLGCFLLITQFHSLCQAQSAYLKPDRVFEGDIVNLTIEYDSEIPSLYAIDTSALEADFEVLESSSRLFRLDASDQIIPDRAAVRMQWKIQILPRRAGILKIPSLDLGGKPTPVLSLEVMQQSPADRSRHNVFVQITARPENPYVGQQTQITMQLFHNTPLIDGGLSEPDAEDVTVFRSLDESRYTTTLDGTQFNVLERSISLFAKSPGDVRIAPANFRGHLLQQTSELDLPRWIYRKSDALQLKVRNVPVEFQGHTWLPAQNLEISQQWQQLTGELRVGESLERTLTIVATGLAAETLPADLLALDGDQIQVYADEEMRSNRFEGDTLVGRLEQTFAVVVTQPGEINLPEIVVKWWDVVEDIEKEVRLPGRKITVLSAISKPQLLSGHPGVSSSRVVWYWSLIFLIILSAASWFGYKAFGTQAWNRLHSFLDRRRIHSRLKLACLSNNPLAARNELINWGRDRWPDKPINGLYQIKNYSSSVEMAAELAKLDTVLYSPNPEDWHGGPLWQFITRQQSWSRSATSQRIELPQLYPQQS